MHHNDNDRKDQAKDPVGHVNQPIESPDQDDVFPDLPDANVAPDGHCIQPSYAEAVRIDTGEPCDDGRDGG